MSELNDLMAKGLIVALGPDPPMAEQWISDARRHLEAAEAIGAIRSTGAILETCARRSQVNHGE